MKKKKTISLILAIVLSFAVFVQNIQAIRIVMAAEDGVEDDASGWDDDDGDDPDDGGDTLWFGVVHNALLTARRIRRLSQIPGRSFDMAEYR